MCFHCATQKKGGHYGVLPVARGSEAARTMLRRSLEMSGCEAYRCNVNPHCSPEAWNHGFSLGEIIPFYGRKIQLSELENNLPSIMD